ncbi:hypothetical protein BKA65DRAFT_265424 [Rhexocercosporidium sp. MPI-PUGE-AT-0058]|nr:hypothetical protein BKA65DRAFT_265424 [Rhexocercosporidium sp. MPI-PUGE-AT-0058]
MSPVSGLLACFLPSSPKTGTSTERCERECSCTYGAGKIVPIQLGLMVDRLELVPMITSGQQAGDPILCLSSCQFRLPSLIYDDVALRKQYELSQSKSLYFIFSFFMCYKKAVGTRIDVPRDLRLAPQTLYLNCLHRILAVALQPKLSLFMTPQALQMRYPTL